MLKNVKQKMALKKFQEDKKNPRLHLDSIDLSLVCVRLITLIQKLSSGIID